MLSGAICADGQLAAGSATAAAVRPAPSPGEKISSPIRSWSVSVATASKRG